MDCLPSNARPASGEALVATHGDDTPASSRLPGFWEHHFLLLATLVIGVAILNLAFRLRSEVVTEWDESLYATSAWEMVRSGNWIATTFHGQLDYYNTKPPLNVWLIALSFKLLGVNLVALRLPSVAAALCTVGILVVWARRPFGAAVGLLSGLVLASTFGFLYVHAARSANTDALFALLVLLTAVTLSACRRPGPFVWLGPILAAVFLLRGMAVVMPIALIAGVATCVPAARPTRRDGVVACVLFLLPVGAWAFARSQVDGWRFFQHMLGYDFLGRSLTVLEGHRHHPLYYGHILVKHHYDWLLAALVAGASMLSWRRIRDVLRSTRTGMGVVLASWGMTTTVIPTLMRTKLPWYLNAFYPLLALALASIIVKGLEGARSARRAVVCVMVVVAFTTAEARLLWYSVHYRNVRRSVQGLVMAEADAIKGHRVFRGHWDRAEIFVVDALAGAEHRLAASVDDFLHVSQPGDYLVTSQPVRDARLVPIRSLYRQYLSRRID